MVWLEYSGPPLNVAHFDQSGHFGWLDWNVPFHFDKIVVTGMALLYPVYKNSNQMRGGLGRVCATRMYCFIRHMKFQTGIFVE